MTLRDKINNMSNRELSEMLIKDVAEEDYDYTYDGEDEYLDFVGLSYSYKTTDGKVFYDSNDAVEYQIELLKGEMG